MKLAIIALALMSLPEQVTVTSAIVNQNSVLVVEVQGRSATYLITCDVDEDTCKVPPKGSRYFLGETDNKVYKCHNVELYDNAQRFGQYCLSGEY